MKRRLDPVMSVIVHSTGVLLIFVAVAILFFLGRESRYALEQTFPFGYRFAVTGVFLPEGYELEQDLYSTIVGSTVEALDGIDEKEETMRLSTMETLNGDVDNNPVGALGTYIPFVAGDAEGEKKAAQTGLASIDPMFLFRDDWRAAKPAEKGEKFNLFAFGTSRASGKMVLRWEPDSSFLPSNSPYRFQLKLVRAPVGVSMDPVTIDLRQQPSGTLELPAWQAKSDADRTKGYLFEVSAIPGDSTPVAAIKNLFGTDWAPTLGYARFGVVPLIISTLLITFIAVLLATPVSIGLALYLSEFAPSKVREWLKPTIELLASIPTVVLAYVGLITVAPLLLQMFAGSLGMENGRSMLTAAVMMGILLIPTIATVAEDTLAHMPHSLRDGADALGLTPMESIRQVLLPAAKSGLIAAVLLGMARAFGETMLVWLLAGGTVRMPSNGMTTLGQATKGIPDTIGIEMGNVSMQSAHYGHLFLIGLLLFLITFAINLTGYRMAKKGAWTQ